MAEMDSEVKEEFVKRLLLLLRDFDVEINIENFWTGYAELGSDNRMIVSFADIYHQGEIDLGTSIDFNTTLKEILK